MRQWVAVFKTPFSPLNGLSHSNIFDGGFLLAQCAKVNVAGGGLKV